MMDSRRVAVELERLKEKVEVLNGDRPRAHDQVAVRRGDVAVLAPLSGSQQSTEAAAAPTQAEFNALVADVRALFNALELLAQRVQ